MSHRVLLVLTSHGDLGGVRPTGWFVGEAAHPWEHFRAAGYDVDVASIAGGVAPQDGLDLDDPVQQAFLSDEHIAAQLADTPKLAEVDPASYDAVLFVGGHGTMWDFPNDPDVDRVGRAVFEDGGVVAAVCHGPSALLGITLSDGSSIVADRRVAGFTNAEEEAVGLTEAVPFLLEDELVKRGATHVPAENFTDHVVVDGRLVTGQNPQSASSVGRAVVDLLG